MNRLSNLLIGGSGIVAVEAAPNMVQNLPMDAPDIAQVIVQLIIGIVTIIGMFKKNKRVTS